MESYPETYEKYKKFAIDRGCPYWPFDEWMQKKDAPPPSKFKQTLDFLREMEKLTAAH